MAYNATIASQISRISAARNLLRTKGVELGLNVPAGTYWDDNSDKEVTTSEAVLLKATDQIDKVAAAFDEIDFYPQNEIKVPILLKTNGTTVVGETALLNPGFYSGALIKPFITVESDEDFVIDVQSKTVTLKSRSNVGKTPITPDDGYNYMDKVFYTIQDGAIDSEPDSFDNTGVTAKVKTSGWLEAGDTQKITVKTSALTSQTGSDSAKPISSGAVITPDSLNDIIITIGEGIYSTIRTLKVESVKSQTAGSATTADILAGKVAWVDGKEVIGNMTNFTNKSTAADSLVNNSGKLAIKPSETGYYNSTTTITTDIVYNPIRVFNTDSITTASTDTMTSQTYYETIPSGYYAAPITRTITVQDAVGAMAVDYTNHKVSLNVSTAGWIDNGDVVDVAINAGPATYVAKLADATQYTVAAESNAYLTQVTIDNTAIYNALSAI
jgi:hypothetical protein